MKKAVIMILVISLLGLAGCNDHNDTWQAESSGEVIAEPDTAETVNKEPDTAEIITDLPETTEGSVQLSDTTEPQITVTEPEPEPDPVPVERSSIVAYFAQDPNMIADAVTYTVSESDYAQIVIFESAGVNTAFSVASVDMSGDYFTLEPFELNGIELSDGQKIAVILDFPGDMSTWYFSYIDNMGDIHEHMISVSGLDGSLVTMDWEPYWQ